jgi:hypothetical protein
MAGLSHYQNSLSAINKFEPVYLNQFEVTILPPAAVAGGEILLQHVTKVSGLSLDKNPGITTQKYKFAKRNYAGAKPENTYMDLNLSFTVNLNDDNSMYVFKTLRQWSDLIYNPLTGAMGLKRDYTGTIVISVFNKSGDVHRRVTCRDTYPSKPINAMNLNYGSTDIFKINDMTWAVDYWEDLFL